MANSGLWNPRMPFGVNPGQRCVAHDPETGQQCLNASSQPTSGAAARLFHQLSYTVPNSEPAERLVRNMVPNLLCHKCQNESGPSIADSWVIAINNIRNSRTAPSDRRLLPPPTTTLPQGTTPDDLTPRRPAPQPPTQRLPPRSFNPPHSATHRRSHSSPDASTRASSRSLSEINQIIIGWISDKKALRDQACAQPGLAMSILMNIIELLQTLSVGTKHSRPGAIPLEDNEI